MNRERWERVRQLFHDCVDLEPAARRERLERDCGGDAGLRTEVESLLAHADANAAFLEQPAAQLAGDASVPAAHHAWIGRRLGPWRVDELLGEGGMGAVFRASRADGQYEQQVAIKLIRHGLEDAAALQRFKAERQILASLQHPHIARLLDGGITPESLPFLVMELIDGEPIDQYCQRLALAVPQRVKLFCQVCDAVQYAHQRLVVHRDIKPGNILVTAEGTPKLLDFGIAKVLEPGDATITLQRAMTPEYSSPEQLKGEPVTTASDVYSLGVVLYRLLTERSPYRAATTDTYRFTREVCETEPVRPSAATGGDAPAPLRRQLRGDLDSIVLKALRKQAAQRYGSADQLADDLRRHLMRRPVRARDATFAYRTGRFVARNWMAVTGGAVVLAAALAGGTLYELQERRALVAAEQAALVKGLLQDVFAANPRNATIDAELQSLPAQLRLQKGAQLIEEKFAGQPRQQAELFGVISRVYCDMGVWDTCARYTRLLAALQGSLAASHEERRRSFTVLTQANLLLENWAEAESAAKQALAESGDDSRSRADSLVWLTLVYRAANKHDASRDALDQADRILAGIPGPSPARARSMAQHAYAAVAEGRMADARPLYLAAIDEALAAEGPLSVTAIDLRVNYAWNFTLMGRAAEAMPQFDAGLQALQMSGAAAAIRAARIESTQARVLFQMGLMSYADANARVARDREIVSRAGPILPPSLKAGVDFNQGAIYALWGDFKLGGPLIESSSAELGGANSSTTQFDRYMLDAYQGGVAMYRGRHERAGPLLRAKIEDKRAMEQLKDPLVAPDFAWVAVDLTMQDRFDEALRALDSMPAIAALSDPATPSFYRGAVARARARIELSRGNAAAALRLLPAVDNEAESKIRLSLLPLDGIMLRGEALCALGRRSEGLARLDRVFKLRAGVDYEYHPELARARAAAGLCALDAGQRARAVAYAALAGKAFDEQPDVSPWFKRPYLKLQERLNPPASTSR